MIIDFQRITITNHGDDQKRGGCFPNETVATNSSKVYSSPLRSPPPLLELSFVILPLLDFLEDFGQVSAFLLLLISVVLGSAPSGFLAGGDAKINARRNRETESWGGGWERWSWRERGWEGVEWTQ